MVSERVALAKLAAKRQIGTLRSLLNYNAAHGKSTKQDIEQAHSHLQQEISKARFVLRHLSTCIEASGDDPSDCILVSSLQNVLDSAVVERSKVYETVFGQQKRESLKSYTQSIHDLIERGEAPHWISTVTKEELINHGEEINRLFQLLIEGQGSSSSVPLVDSVTLVPASERTDMFTPKQCESLSMRSVEVDYLMLKETERLAQGLQDEEAANLFLATNESYNEDSSNKSGWACHQCTFQNEADEDRCSACDARQTQSFLTVAKRKPNKIAPKDVKPAPATKTTSTVLIKRPPTRGSTTNTLWILNKYVPEMIGPRGKHQQAMIAKSGALSIYAFQDQLDKDGMCPIEVQGSQQAFQKVVALLEEKFNPKVLEKVTEGNERIWIRNTDVPDLIGPGGATIKELKAKTGVKSITAWQELVNDDGMCPIVIRGRPEATKKAAATIMSMYCGVTDGLLPETIDRSAALPPASLRSQQVTASRPGSMAAARLVPPASQGRSIILSTNKSLPSISIGSQKTPFLPLSTEETSVESAFPPPTTSSSMTAKLKSALKVSSDTSPTKDELVTLFDFLKEHEKCLTCSAEAFGGWLDSVQISNLEEFAEALEDDDFVSLEMKANGLKYFKRFALQKAIAACNDTSPTVGKDPYMPTPISEKATSEQEPPHELVCPIRHVLMTTDPVLAPDGYTYERESIESWLQLHGDIALSPMTHEPLVDGTLVSNVIIRTLARDWLRVHSQE